ncbi:MAG: 6-bladed beta-propeller [Candidatus Aminicenantes bacterium]|nr:6-bladed beta-propeller [Candidatus Aminicenantes bacterium]
MQKRKYIHRILIFSLMFLLSITSQFLIAQEKSKVENINGVEVISNPKLPIYKDGLKIKLVFREELSIGQIEGDENYMFGAGISFNTDEEGNFYVTDFANTKIVKYTPNGEYILSFGRKGQGPGEFQNMSVTRFDKDGFLYVTDSTNRRISFFNKNGEFIRQIHLSERFIDLYINSESLYVGRKWDMLQEEKAMKQISVFGLFNSDLEIMEEIYTDEIATPLPSGRDETSIVQYLASSYSVLAFRPEGWLALNENDLIYFSCPVDYMINIYSQLGKLQKVIKRDYEPIHITKNDEESFLNNMSEGLASSANIPQGTFKKALEKIKFPSYKPAFQKFTLMENGWLFVIVDSIPDEYALIDLFDQDGEYIAQFELKMPLERIFFKNGKAYAVATENDYKFVKRYNYEIQEFKFYKKTF